jgi:hypothetical protein
MDTMCLPSTGTPCFFPLWPCLQNRRWLDLLMAEKGKLCLFLGEDCCFFTNKTGMVRDRIKKLRDSAQQLTSSQSTNNFHLVPMAHPAGGPSYLCLAVMFLPCVINILQKFSQESITATSWATSGEQFKTIMPLQTLQAEQLPTLPLATYVCAYIHVCVCVCVCVCVYVPICDIYIIYKKAWNARMLRKQHA